ncbi:two component transcriptional regulator, LytTR family [Cyclonatronum proteinivorum]|uniref:Two component transcriptional regulator, LytTR family n=1 Tax=Cyclonatronum proteinivorum TaxID=1457365 RepID=A0A345UFX1_9BACT|nr:LytTR family DNA-binding domain-containing protein [Cyclonatronum proteinivorum]AXI99372.1 two component transcriptional regulator, LytTR family [Cyclonatronum proteinivorum]
MRVFLVDDEDLARSRLRTLLEASDLPVEIAGESGNPAEAVSLIRDSRPDLLFLDIQMPQLDGFDVIDLLGDACPQVIFVTAYDQFAIKAFEVHALDYLTKPVRLERLVKALQRAQKLSDSENPASGLQSLRESRKAMPLKRISAHTARGVKVLGFTEILYFETEEKIVVAVSGHGRLRVDFTLDELEERLPGQDFLRIHRSSLVNANAISSLEPWFNGNWQATLTNGEKLTVARRRVTALKQRIGFG